MPGRVARGPLSRQVFPAIAAARRSTAFPPPDLAAGRWRCDRPCHPAGSSSVAPQPGAGAWADPGGRSTERPAPPFQERSLKSCGNRVVRSEAGTASSVLAGIPPPPEAGRFGGRSVGSQCSEERGKNGSRRSKRGHTGLRCRCGTKAERPVFNGLVGCEAATDCRGGGLAANSWRPAKPSRMAYRPPCHGFEMASRFPAGLERRVLLSIAAWIP